MDCDVSQSLDSEILRWTLDSVIAQVVKEEQINSLCDALHISKGDVRLKKSRILRRIECDISNESISENILELLKLMEDILSQEGNEISIALKTAQCMVAVDCTVRFQSKKGQRADFVEAVERIWKKRPIKMESDELFLEWKDAIEDALWKGKGCDPTIIESIRPLAITALQVFVKEAKGSMMPSFYEDLGKALKHDDGLSARLGWEENKYEHGDGNSAQQPGHINKRMKMNPSQAYNGLK